MNTKDLNIRTILVEADFTPAAYIALLYAKRFAKCCSSKLVLIHIADPEGSSSEEMEVTPSVLRDTIESARAELERLSAELTAQGIENQWLVRHGNVRDLTLELVTEFHADLLVLGNEGMVPECHSRCGVIAEQLMRASPCPVLTIVPEARWQELEDGHRRILLVPTDFSEASQAALMYALRFVRAIDASIIFVHVVEPQSLSSIVGEMIRLRPGKMEMWLAYTYVTHVKAEAVFRRGDLCEAIPALARERKADYIIMGVRGGNLVDGMRLNSRLQELVCQSPCPVLSDLPRSISYTVNCRSPRYVPGHNILMPLIDSEVQFLMHKVILSF